MDTNKQPVVIKMEPLNPNCLPNKPAKQAPKTVNKINSKYIYIKYCFCINGIKNKFKWVIL
jgi:hypothetical protein